MSSVNTGSCHPVTTPASGQFLANHQIQGSSWSGFPPTDQDIGHNWGISSVTENETFDGGTGGAANGSWTRNTGGTLTADENYMFRARGYDNGYQYGSVISSKTAAMIAVVSTPTSSAITATTATIACNYTPRTLRSTCSAQLQYKKTTDVIWINAGAPAANGGYSNVNHSLGITGLESSTQYQVRLVITRGTVNDTSLTSPTHSFTTLAGEPLVTTNAATGVAAASATLNGSLVINAGTGVNVYFKWDTVNPPVANQTANQPMSADGTFNQAISGLSANTTYFFQAFVSFSTPTGSPNEGSVLSFTTPADPLAEAAQEDHVFIREFNERKYGVATKLIFPVASPAATSSDRYFNAASPFVAGDVKVAQDTGAGLGAFTNVGTLPVRIGTTPAFELSLTAGEMSGYTVIVSIVDQDGPAYRDQMIVIRTAHEVGKVDIDATAIGGNVSAFTATGVGSGHGINAVSGATGKDISGVLGSHVSNEGLIATGAANPVLASTASAVDDFYNDMVILITGGTGAGQARLIKDYNGTTKAVTPYRAFSTNPATNDPYIIIPGEANSFNAASPGAELTAVPTFNSSFGVMLQLVFQRFAYKIEQTATTQTWRKADASTSFASRSVSDDGSTQTVGMLT